jgi:hypothetical protein
VRHFAGLDFLAVDSARVVPARNVAGVARRIETGPDGLYLIARQMLESSYAVTFIK